MLAGGRSRAEEHSEKHGIRWIYAPDGAGLADQLAEAGILAPKSRSPCRSQLHHRSYQFLGPSDPAAVTLQRN